MVNLCFLKGKEFVKRVFGYDAETRAAFLVFIAALVNTVLCAVAVFAVAVYLLFRKKGALLFKKGNRSGFLFSAVVLFASAINLNYFGIAGTLFFLAVLLIAYSFRENITKQKIDDVFTLMVAYSIVAFVVAVVQKIFNLSAIEGRSASTFMNALYYCYYIAFVILICLFRIIYENRNKLFYFSALALNVAAIIVTGSKMPLFAIAAAVFVMLLFAKKFKILIPLTILGVAAGVLIIVFQDVIVEKLQMNSFVDSLVMRFDYWKPAINGFVKRPVFGHGMLGILNESVKGAKQAGFNLFDFNNLEVYFDELKHIGWHLHAHNIALECLYSFGAVGTALIGFSIIKRCRQLYIQSGRNLLSPYMTLVMSSLVYVFVNGIVDCQIVGVQTAFLSIFLFSLTAVKE